MNNPLILVVDDSLTARMKLKSLLEPDGARVVLAGTVTQATELAVEHRPDVVILDVVLPDGNGIEVCKQWRDNPTLKDTLVLLISGERSGHDDRAAGLRAGALGYVVKPFSDPELLAQVWMLVRLNATLREMREAKEAVDAANRTKDESLARLSHELAERKRAEEEMRRLRLLLQNMIDSMPSSLVAVDAEGRVTHWNRRAEEAVGVSLEEAEGQPLDEAFPAMETQLAQVGEAIRQRKVKSAEKLESYTDGERHFSDVMVYPLVANGVDGAVIRVDDVTERVRLEEMVIQSEKMLTVGGLAAGMAHEINNPLAAIIQNIQVVLECIASDLAANHEAARACGTSLEAIRAYMDRQEITELLNTVRTSGGQAAQIVENMLSFSRKSDAHFSTHKLSGLIDQTVELATSDYDLKKKFDFKQIEIVREFDPDLPEVTCEGTKIQQVILNLLKNGAQAMAEQKDQAKPPRFILRTLRDGNMARIEVEDNGPGMSKEVRKRVFEPFFTTKDVGVGTGLGLSVSYFIITENHGGTMSVESRPGRGATFIIRLPLEGQA